MPILINCPKCKSELKVSKSKAGRKGRCPKCGTTIHVPPLRSARKVASARARKQQQAATKLATLRDRRSRASELLKIVLVVALALTAVEIVESLYLVFQNKFSTDIGSAGITAKTFSELWGRLSEPATPAHGLSSLLFGFALLIATVHMLFTTKVFDGWWVQSRSQNGFTVQAGVGSFYAMLLQLGLLYWAGSMIRDTDLMLPTIVLGTYFVVGAAWRACLFMSLSKPLRKRIRAPFGWALTHAVVGAGIYGLAWWPGPVALFLTPVQGASLLCLAGVAVDYCIGSTMLMDSRDVGTPARRFAFLVVSLGMVALLGMAVSLAKG